jgi:hypothetical protein
MPAFLLFHVVNGFVMRGIAVKKKSSKIFHNWIFN